MNQNAEYVGKVALQVGGRGYYASVTVTFQEGDTLSVVLDSAARLGHAPDDWLNAAIDGACVGAKLANRSGSFTISRVHGMECDTSPALVAIAAVRAVWLALPFSPNDELVKCVEGLITRGHELGVAEVKKKLCG
jgi:hypothetical protein